MNVWQTAWRNLMRRKLRTWLTVLSILIGVASTLAVISSVDTAKRVFPLYLKAAFGKADYSINGTEAVIQEQVLEEAGKIPHTVSIAVLKKAAKLQLDQQGITAIQKRVDVGGYSRLDTPLTNFKLISGSLSGNGAVITSRTAGVWKKVVGDTISIETDQGVREIQISAIVAYTAELMGPSSWTMAKYHPWTVAVPLTVAQEWFGLSGKIDNVQLKATGSGDLDDIGKQVEELAVKSDGLYVQPVVLDFDSQFQALDSFFLALYLAGLLGIALSAFIMFNSLYVSIQERRSEFAVLKTIGYSPGHLQAFVLAEVLLLSILGTAAGLAAGYGLSKVLKTVIFLVFSVHDDSGVLLTKGLVAAVLAGLLVPAAAALYPIRQAGKVSVIEALRPIRPKTKGSFGKWKGILGVLLIGCAFFIRDLLLLIPLLTGLVFVYPYLFRAFVRLLKPLYRMVFGFYGEMALRNLNRNPGRTAMTSAILSLGIAMILLMSSLNSALLQTYEKVIYSSYGGNLDVEFHHIEPTDLARMKQVEGVADAQTYPLHSAVWSLGEQKRILPVYGIGEEWVDRFPLFAVEGRKHSDLIRPLKSNEIILDKIAFTTWGGRIGDSIQLATLNGVRNFTVTTVVDTMKNSGYGAFLKEEAFREAFGLKYTRNALVLHDEHTSPLQLRERVFDAFGERIEKMFGPEDWVSVVGATYTGSFSIINGLVVLAILISGIGITNTLLMNIMERIRELGMMRAIGVTRRQLVGMVLAEGAGIGLGATVIGCASGILLIYLTSTFFAVNSLTYEFGVSWIIVLLVGLFGLSISLFASFTPASRAAKTKLSEALRYE